MSKISTYTTLSTPASGDWVPVVDVSDTTMAATGTTKKIAAGNLVDLLQLAATDWQPADNGLLAWNYDLAPTTAGTSTALATAGTMYVQAIPVRSSISVTNLVTLLTVNGGTLTSGQCFGALYQGAGGARIGTTADQATAWGSGATKLVTMALSGGPFTVSAGIVYAAFWFNGTTGPTFYKTAGTALTANLNLAAAASRWGTANTGQTTTAPATLGTISAAANAYWTALS